MSSLCDTNGNYLQAIVIIGVEEQDGAQSCRVVSVLRYPSCLFHYLKLERKNNNNNEPVRRDNTRAEIQTKFYDALKNNTECLMLYEMRCGLFFCVNCLSCERN